MYNIYFAGELFDHKHLIGNKMLSNKIELISENRFKIILPQDIEFPSFRSQDIRDYDLINLVKCDLAIFNFDGVDLDSGTVVEFMVAKFLDIPSVLIRTDFRKAGDQDKGGNYNLMCSNFPRSIDLEINSLEIYKKYLEKTGEFNSSEFYTFLAKKIIECFDILLDQKSILVKNKDMINNIYKWISMFANEEYRKKFEKEINIKELIEKKIKKRYLFLIPFHLYFENSSFSSISCK